MNQNAYCHFCAKWANEVKAFVDGPADAGICNECSDLIAGMMAEKMTALSAASGRAPTKGE